MNRFRIGKGILFGAQVVFVIVAFIFIEWMQNYASGNIDAEFDFSALTSWWRWVVVAAQTVLAVYIVNLIMTYTYSEKKTRATSRMCKILKTNELRIDKIYTDKMLDRLDEAVKRVNKNARDECNLRHMRKLNARIVQDDLDKMLTEADHIKLAEAVKHFKRMFCVMGVNEKRFDDAVGKLLSGKFTDFETITAEALLEKGTFDHAEEEQGVKDERSKVHKKQLIKKAVWSVMVSFALGVIVRDLIMEFSIVSAVANSIYIFMAIISGVFSASRYCSYVEGLFDRRNNIFSKELGINDTWQPPEPPPPTPKKRKREEDEYEVDFND